MRHKPRNIALLSVLALLVVGVTASAASAAIQFEWKVNGAALASGNTKEVTGKDKSSGLFHFRFTAAGAAYEFSSSAIKFKASKIAGGRPGAGEGTLVLEGIKTVTGNCTIKGGTITTRPLNWEIVESAEAGVGLGISRLLFTPQVGTAVANEIKFEGQTCLYGPGPATLAGSLLAEVGPKKEEAKVDTLSFVSTAKSVEYKNAKNEYKNAFLTFNSVNAASITGEAETELVSKEVFGAY
jgi:hypothetical protein